MKNAVRPAQGLRNASDAAVRSLERRLDIEHAVTRVLEASDSVAQAIPEVIRVICEALGWACGARWLVADEGLRCAETWGVDAPGVAEFLAATRALPPSPEVGGLNRRACAERKPLWLLDVTSDPTFRRAAVAAAAGLRSAFAFPVKAGAEVIAVMEFFGRELQPPDGEMLDCTSYIASQLGQFVQRKQAEQVMSESEERLRSLTELSSDYYWVSDAAHRLVRTQHGRIHRPLNKDRRQFGKCRWQLPSTFPDAAGWAAHRATLERHAPFRDFEFARIDDDGVERWLAISGEPTFDAAGAFTGYRGVGKDVTERKRDEKLLNLEHTVARCLADANDRASGLQAVLRAVCEAKSWECGRFFRREQDDVFRFGEAWHVPGTSLERFIAYSRGKAFPRGVGIVGIAGSGEVVWTPDIGVDPRMTSRAMVDDHGMRGALMFPALAEGQVIGVLSFTSREIREPDERLLRTTGVIGSLVGQFVQRKQAEQDVRKSEERFRSLTELSSDWYWEQDENFRFIDMTHAAPRGGRRGPTSAVGQTRWDVPALNMTEADWAAHRAVLEAHQPFRDLELHRLTAEGNSKYTSVSGEPIFDRSGKFKGYRGVGKDITARKRDEQVLRLEHAVSRQLAGADSELVGVMACVREICQSEGWECGRYFRLDEPAALLRFVGGWGGDDPDIERYIARSRGLTYAKGEGLTGRVWETGEALWVSDPGSRHGVGQAVFNAARDVFIFPLLAGNRTVGVLSFISRKLRAPDERLLRALHVLGSQVGQFVQRKQAEEVLRESEERFRMLTKASSDWYWEQDAGLRFVAMGHDIVNKTGISATGHIGKRRWDLPALNMTAADWAAHRAVCEAHLPFHDFELCRRTEDGKPSWVLISGEPIFDAAGTFRGYRGVGKDITARKRAESLRALEHTVTRALAAANSVAELIGAAIRAVCESEGWDCGRYFAPAGKLSELRMAFAWGVDDPAVQRFLASSAKVAYRPGVGLAGRVWESGEPLWVDTERDSRVVQRELNKSSGMRGAFVFPVIADGKTIGVLTFSSRARREPEEALLQAIRLIGIQIGQFLQRKQAEQVLRESEERFRSLTSLSSDVYWEQDEEFRFTAFSGTGVQRVKPPLGKRRWEQNYLNMTAEAWAAHIAALEAHQPFRDMELCRLDEQGGKVWVSVSGEPVFDAAGRFRGYRGVGKDITARKLDEERIQYLATHDALTSLPNRTMFGELLGLSIHNARRYGRSFAVLFVDLDRFKVINDTLGHEAGDQLLQQVAERLGASVRASDVVARLGGDEFVVLLQEVREPQAETVARKLLAALARPVYLGGQEFRVTASIGISLYPSDAEDQQTLMKNADIAMYRAKEEGKNTCKFYSAKSNSHSFERLALETSLRRGLERREFSLHYQAKVDLHGGGITGVEALLRWQHPDLGMVPPGQFIPLAEETGLIVPLGKWVLRAACEQGVAWRQAGLPPVRISVNISARQFADEHLLEDVAQALAVSGLEPQLLELELTESMVMHNAERAASVLAAIKNMGMRLAIDDFGVGYSSLAQLKRLPIDTLKIDRSFIRDIPQDAEDSAIAEAIIAMGKRLHLMVVAEGVETSEQHAFLKAHDCDEMQGFFFSRPVPAAEFGELLRKSRAVL